MRVVAVMLLLSAVIAAEAMSYSFVSKAGARLGGPIRFEFYRDSTVLIGQLQSAVGNAINALGLTRPQHSSANVANLGAIRRSTPTGVQVLPTGNGGSIVVVPWTIQLLDKQSKPTLGGGIWIDERIQHSNDIAFSPREKKYGGFWTKPHRVVLDIWTLPFRAPNGQVTTTQTLVVGGREATLRATVHANGMIEEGAEYWAPFH